MGRAEIDRDVPEALQPEAEPIEPDAGGRRKPVLRWVLFLVFVLWAVLTAYHEPLLTRIGGFLVVSHELENADLIVCLSGRQVERGLAAADLYGEKPPPRVFIAPEVPPDGYEALERAGIEIPRSVDILRRILVESGVPEEAVIEAEQPARSTMGEARMAVEVADENGYRSLIVVTSPTHTRRAWMAFRHATEDDAIAIRMAPSSYSGFRAENWWKTRRYVKEVIVEYQKLLYYSLEYLL
ncbi:MAG: YdcF family protein [Deltaproteobacteria bacterium]|nr:YdcF family protein [Deltaproteobacteria bacterium]